MVSVHYSFPSAHPHAVINIAEGIRNKQSDQAGSLS